MTQECADWSLIMDEPITKQSSGSAFLIRLHWIFGGNVILFFLVIFIIDKHLKFPSWHDLAYWVTVITLLAARYIDIHYMQGETAEGKPASMSDFRTYTLITLIASSLAWALTCVFR